MILIIDIIRTLLLLKQEHLETATGMVPPKAPSCLRGRKARSSASDCPHGATSGFT